MANNALIKDFEALLGPENVFSSEADRQSYSYDSAVLAPVVPTLVVRPPPPNSLASASKNCTTTASP